MLVSAVLWRVRFPCWSYWKPRWSLLPKLYLLSSFSLPHRWSLLPGSVMIDDWHSSWFGEKQTHCAQPWHFACCRFSPWCVFASPRPVPSVSMWWNSWSLCWRIKQRRWDVPQYLKWTSRLLPTCRRCAWHQLIYFSCIRRRLFRPWSPCAQSCPPLWLPSARTSWKLTDRPLLSCWCSRPTPRLCARCWRSATAPVVHLSVSPRC